METDRTTRIKNASIPQRGRGGRRGAGQDRTLPGRFALETTDPLVLQSIEDNCPRRLFASTNKRNTIKTDNIRTVAKGQAEGEEQKRGDGLCL